ncbi:MAG: serine protease [Mesorhizobium sp.]|nr:serine protease [bacterium M00.F.Ca.ET.205.01.1.1]TGU54690.1 serine protease [bacterium M00.F.Ca.ET.152.01.1.1]TGV38978.1 serine protease [Mesorhizobium sp. M00.F.Ca.ET.186.01.1.1]TGZ44262.1 serine protease [bacterium M00.F.Ca.ET.162.01.1.1]TJW31234.1 MAG: serine protease [Mesorhizobium sp.]
MANSEIEDTIAAVGYAKVLVTLAPNVMGAALEATTAGGDNSVRALAEAKKLEKHFIVPSEAQQESLALGARVSASRNFNRAVDPATRRLRVYPHLGLAIGYVDKSGAAALEASAATSNVVKAPELSLIRPTAVRPAHRKAALSWGLKALGADAMWSAGFDGKDVVVGHLDTGVDGSHPSLKGAIFDFAEFDLAGDKVPNAKPHDSGEHGTHTAGTIAGRAGAKGAFGMAPGAKLASGLVIEGGQVIERILSGMDWIIERGCPILSMSLGLRGFTPAFEQIINALRTAGVLPVIAVGNEGALSSRSPGNYDTVLSVGAMDAAQTVPLFSSSQKFTRPNEPLVPDLVAPGMGVLSCIPGGRFAEMDGTSMATPHIAGLAALLRQARPQASIADLEQAILGSCRLPPGMPVARGNRGVPNGPRAFQLLTGSPLPVAATAASRRRPVKPAAAAARPGKPVAAKKRAGRPVAAAARAGKPGKKAKPT